MAKILPKFLRLQLTGSVTRSWNCQTEVNQDQEPEPLRAMALNGVPVDHPKLTLKTLTELAGSNSQMLLQEVVHVLNLHRDESRLEVLSKIARNTDIRPGIRADAIAALAPFAFDNQKLLTDLAGDSQSVVSAEAKRTLGIAGLTERGLPAMPEGTDLPAWERMIDSAPGEADLEAGKRLFFHQGLLNCAKCHTKDGRGIEVGPDLTEIGQQPQGGRKWLLTHIQDPNSEVAPYYRPQMITTRDGSTLMGFILGKEGKAQGYVGPDGKKFSVLKSDVVAREELPVSLMPPGLLLALAPSEIRDLMAYLLNETK